MTDINGGITVETRGHILLIGLDRPQKYNSYTPQMAAQLVTAMTELDENPELRVGVIFGHGKHFCAGLDLPQWTDLISKNDAHLHPPGGVDPLALQRRCRKPIVTAVQGITFTLGIELALAGDIIIAADDCRFSQLEPARGIQATGGATFRFVERGGWGNAMLHLLTSDEFNAQEALRIGIAQEVVPTGQQLERALQIAERIASQAPLAVQATKASARLWAETGERACIDDLPRAQARLMQSADAAEGVRSFIERRAAVFKGV